MKKLNTIIKISVFLLLLISCSSNVSDTENTVIDAPWSVSKEEVLGPYAPFPLITNSSFVGVNDVNYPENHLIALVSLGPNELRAYPNAYIGLYEVINNEFEDKKYAVTHCPLTGSTICWDRIVDNNTITIKPSGYLYRNNIMPTDIETGSIWSQMLMRGVSGVYDYTFYNTYNLIETDWKTVKDYFPQAKVYHEGDNDVVIDVDPVAAPTNRDFYRYGIVSGINNTTIHTFSYNLFDENGLQLITTTIAGKKTIVIGNKNLNFITSYYIEDSKEYFISDPESLQFEDNTGNIYNALGVVIEGPDKDMQLTSPKAYTAAWVAWQDFFENFVIY